jgi:enamine deaminase RidA (YjgF/YER057c/UK114 family)
MTDTVGMAAEFVSSARLFADASYAYAATAPETGLVLTAGACPLDDQGRVVAPGDIALQMRRAIDNLPMPCARKTPVASPQYAG